MKEHERDCDGNRFDFIPYENDHSIDVMRYAMTDNCMRG